MTTKSTLAVRGSDLHALCLDHTFTFYDRHLQGSLHPTYLELDCGAEGCMGLSLSMHLPLAINIRLGLGLTTLSQGMAHVVFETSSITEWQRHGKQQIHKVMWIVYL